MTIVKGSKIRPVKVTYHRPFMRIFVVIALACIFAASVRASFYFGQKQGQSRQEKTLADVAIMEDQLQASVKKIEELEQTIANTSLGAEIDRQANEEVRLEVMDLKEKIAALEKENGFYRGLMAPTKNQRGLSIGAVEISQTDRPRTFSYKVVMQQLATNHQLLNGTLKYSVEGRLNGENVTYALKDLSRDVSTELIKLRFKYFQNVEGELQLPEGFEPEGISILARSIGKNAVTVEKRFGWLVEEI